MITTKAAFLSFLASAILWGSLDAEPREMEGLARRSMQEAFQRNLSKDLEDGEDGPSRLFLLGDEAVSPLIKFLSDPDEEKRIAAARVLAYIGNPQGMQALRNAIKAERDEETRSDMSCFLAGALVATKSETDLDFLRDSVESARPGDDDWEFPAYCAALALGMRGGSDSLSLLRKAAKANETDEIGKAVRWMEKKSAPRRITTEEPTSDEGLIKNVVLDGTFFAEELDKTSVEQLTFNPLRNRVLVYLEVQEPKYAHGYDLVLAKMNGEWSVVGIWLVRIVDYVTVQKPRISHAP